MSAYALALVALSASPLSAPPQAAPSGPAATSPDPARLEEVVVTGSLIPAPGRLYPARNLTSRQLEAAGVLDAARLPGLVPANSGSETQVDQLNDPQSSGTAQFNLRNLGLGSTLVLVNGRRQAQSAVVSSDGAGFIDLNSLIPLIALERIDILKDSGSATYGSDAVAGVVNLITRGRVDTPVLRVRHAMAAGSAETLVEGLVGGDLSGGNLVLAASRFHRDSLGSDDRDFTQAERYGRPAWSAVTSYGQPGSFFRPSLSAFAPDPDCDDPAFFEAYRTSAADPFCRLDYSGFFDLAPREDRTQVLATWRGTVAPGVRLNLEAAWTGSETEVRQSPSLPILAGSPAVPADHPDNPFGEAVLFRGRLLGAEAGASRALFTYETGRLAADLSGPIAGSWRWRAATAWSRQTVAYDKPDVIRSRLTAALQGRGGPDCVGAADTPGCLRFNPFGSAYLGTGTVNSPALIDWLTGSTGLRGASSLWTADVLASGDAWREGDASLTVALGAQVRESRLQHDWSNLANQGELLTAGRNEDFDGRETAAAIFVETRLGWSDRFEAQAALRGERFADGPPRLNPRLAAVWSATDSLDLRLGYSESFKAPSVFAREGAQASQPSVFDRGAFVFVNTVTRGDPALRPERAGSLTAAAVWRPWSGIEVSIEGWRHEVSDLIVKESAQSVIDTAAADELAGRTGTEARGRVTRDGTGTLNSVDLRFINAAAVTAQGMDLRAAWSREVGPVSLSAVLDWTRVDRHAVRLSPYVPAVEAVGRTNLATIARSLPRDRADLTLAVATTARRASARLAWASGYYNDRAGVSYTAIRSHLTLDLGWTEQVGSSWSVSLHILNATDAAPPLVQYALGYDPIVHDPRGRVISLGLSRRF